jgi:hypothetical protein
MNTDLTMKKPSGAVCPNCARNLGAKPTGSKPPYTVCPFCGTQLTFVWWQRILIAMLALILTFGVPGFLGIKGIMPLLLVGLLCCYPALVVAIILVFKLIQPRYVVKDGAAITLFHR